MGTLPPSPQRIFDHAYGFAVTRTLASAIELNVFGCIARGVATVPGLGAETRCSEGGMQMLLDALAALGYLVKAGEAYELSSESKAYLTPGTDTYIGGYVKYAANMFWGPWAHLTEIIRTGIPARRVHSDEANRFFPEFVDALYTLNAPAAETVASALLSRDSEPAMEVLDVGAGSAVWSIAFAKRSRRVRVTALDVPDMIEAVTRRFVADRGVSDRYSFWPIDVRQADLGESRQDLIILGHICHGEGASGTQDLLRRRHRALRPAGRLLIAELMPEDDRTGPLLPLLFALNMLVLTEHGSTFTKAEYRAWLANAGFGDVEFIDAPAPSPLIVATR